MENYTDRNDGCNESDILFYIEWAQQREPSSQFHIESVLNGVWVRHYSALNGGRQTPNAHCLFLFNGTHSFLLNSACRSELNGSRQSPNVHCLFLYRWILNFWSDPSRKCLHSSSAHIITRISLSWIW